MIEKADFYHGAAIIRLVQDLRCVSLTKTDYCYVINQDRAVVVKYTTKSRSPWRFTLNSDDVKRLNAVTTQYHICILALVCGGDGICAVKWGVAAELIGDNAGWLAATRRFNGRYSLSGPNGVLARKISINQWPDLVLKESD